MLRAEVVRGKTGQYPTPDPHQAPRGLPAACGEARTRVDPHPTETAVRRADALALSLTAALDRITPALARAAVAFVGQKVWIAFGFARLEDCARERFGRSGRWVKDLAALGAALETAPRLAAALTGDDGGSPRGKVKALQVARIATPDTLDAWVDLARRLTVLKLAETVKRARASGSAWPPESAPGADGIGPAGTAPTPSPGSDEEEGMADRHLVRYMLPAPVLAAFDEALDLYRAVVGSEASVTSFVEALVGGALSGAHPPDLVFGSDVDADARPLQRGPSRGTVESALARSTRNWEHLPGSSDGSWAMALAGASLRRLVEVSRRAGHGGPGDLDEQIRELVALEDRIGSRLGALLAQMADVGAWSRLRFDGAGHYAEQRLGLPRTTAEGLMTAARGLRGLPWVRAAYEEGRIRSEAVLQILRALRKGSADERAQKAWVAHVERATIKRLRDETRELRRQALDPQSAAGGAPAPCDDAAWHASLRREAGTARRRVLRFGRLALAAPVPDVFLRLRLPAALAPAFMACVEAERRRLTKLVEEVPWDQDWPDPEAPPSVLAARTFSVRCRRVPAWVGLLAMLEETPPRRCRGGRRTRSTSAMDGAARRPGAPRAGTSSATTSGTGRGADPTRSGTRPAPAGSTTSRASTEGWPRAAAALLWASPGAWGARTSPRGIGTR